MASCSSSYRQQAYTATSQADGTFEILNVYPPHLEYEIQIAAIADGRLLQSEYISMTTGTLEPIRFQLSASTPLALRFESDSGQPIKGVSAFPFERVDRKGKRHVVYFDSALIRLPEIANAKQRRFYLLHSPQDRVCPYWMAKASSESLSKVGAENILVDYDGGHGWRGDVFGNIRRGIQWLDNRL